MNENARPNYAGAFRCIGPECEDTCCQGWDIPVDKATYERYALFPADQLGWAVKGFVSVAAAPVAQSLYAHIHMAASGECPFFEADRLCGIQKAHGPELLSSTCSSYPRVLNRIDGALEGSLSLSCPEAARNVLLDPYFMARITELDASGFRTDNFFWLGHAGTSPVPKPFAAFQAVRAAMIGLVKDRSTPVWMRLLRVGALCQRLEEMEDAEKAIAEVLGGFEDERLVQLRGNRALRLEIAMRLSDERVRDVSAGRRFQETYWAFAEGISVATLEDCVDDLERMALAERKFYQPYLDSHPHLWENYVVNYIYQKLFPFGRSGSAALRERGILEEFVLLAVQFGWLEMLLIGVAGRSQEMFGGEQIVDAFQSFHREIEHYPAVLEGILAEMVRRGMNDLAGMAVLLK